MAGFGFRKSLIAAALATGATGAAAAPSAVGDWHGGLDVGLARLTLFVTVTDAGGLGGVLESVDQSPGHKIPISEVSAEGEALSFAVAPLAARFDGAWSEEENAWVGEWSQGGLGLPLTLAAGAPPAAPAIEGLDGVWSGALIRNGASLTVSLSVKTGALGTRASYVAPDFGVSMPLPARELSRDGDRISFTASGLNARFEGALEEGPEGARLSGVWTAPNQEPAEARFARADEAPAAPKRPQTPRPPYPYSLDEVAIANPEAEGVTLAGTLSLPQGDGPFPAAILISGTGPQDRDETLFGHKPFAVLADHLTRQGVAVLRYDDRGVGASTGVFTEATLPDFASDARAAVAFLKTRPEIDVARIGLIGHSEGAVSGAWAAAESADVAFLVSLAGPGTGLVDLLASQHRLLSLSTGKSEARIAKELPIVERVFNAMVAAENRDAAEKAASEILTPEALETLGVPEEQKAFLIRVYTAEWFRRLLAHDPAENLSRLEIPVLAVNGSLDRQVAAEENLAAIEAALAANPDAAIVKLDGLNHLFQTAETGNIGEYGAIEETLSPALLDLVGAWILERFGEE